MDDNVITITVAQNDQQVATANISEPIVVVEKPVDKSKLGCTIDGFIGDVQPDGTYSATIAPMFIDASAVKTPTTRAFYYRFAGCVIAGADFTNVEHSLQDAVFGSAFQNATITGPITFNMNSIENTSEYSDTFFYNLCNAARFSGDGTLRFPKLTKIQSTKTFQQMLYYATNAPSFDDVFPVLEEIVATESLFSSAFYGYHQPFTASKLKRMIGPKQTYYRLFDDCDAYIWNFPALEEITGTVWSPYASAREIHFAKANQEKIEACSGYDKKWGAPTTATIYFDL
nr:MAG TPA: hypothetical protein [Caudoviricetes sp.]